MPIPAPPSKFVVLDFIVRLPYEPPCLLAVAQEPDRAGASITTHRGYREVRVMPGFRRSAKWGGRPVWFVVTTDTEVPGGFEIGAKMGPADETVEAFDTREAAAICAAELIGSWDRMHEP